MAYIGNMDVLFIETHVFTKAIHELLGDEEYRKMQMDLVFRPEAGDVIQGTHGLRKLRWKRPGMGKRGGIRVIYYFDKPEKIYMVFVFPKNRQENLTPNQLKYLAAVMKEYLA
jgi:hypothetical protein